MQQDGSVRAHTTTHRGRESQSCQGHPFQLPTPYIRIRRSRRLRLSGVVVISPVLHITLVYCKGLWGADTECITVADDKETVQGHNILTDGRTTDALAVPFPAPARLKMSVRSHLGQAIFTYYYFKLSLRQLSWKSVGL